MFDCLLPVAAAYQVPHEIVESVIISESSGRNVVSTNRDGSQDIGVMQINEWWLPILKRHGIERKDLMNVCTNIAVGSWILGYEYSSLKNWSEALASYNAGRSQRFEPYAQRYADKVLGRLGGSWSTGR